MIKHTVTCDGCGVAAELTLRHSNPGEHDAHVRGEALRAPVEWKRILHADLCKDCVYLVVTFIKRIRA